MKYREFERIATGAFEAIPERYRQGIDGLVVARAAQPHPTLPDVFTLGVCDTEDYVSDWVGPDTTRSVVVLFYGSFQNLARGDPDFDWEAEVHETVEHEVKHHLETLAGRDELEDLDYALEEGFQREEGREFDPWYFQRGEALGGGVFVVEDRTFLEQEWAAGDFATRTELAFEWKGERWRIERPDELGDIHFVRVSGVQGAPPVLEVVLVRRRSWWEDARRLVTSSRPRVLESTATARKLGQGESR